MDNANMPAMPCDMLDDRVSGGLTKREYACIHLCVPESGDPELDAIITKARDTKIAAMMAQGILAGDHPICHEHDCIERISEAAAIQADAVIDELEKPNA